MTEERKELTAEEKQKQEEMLQKYLAEQKVMQEKITKVSEEISKLLQENGLTLTIVQEIKVVPQRGR